MHSSWKSRGGPWVFWQIILRGVLGVVRKLGGGVVFYCIFMWKFFKNRYRGYMRCPSPPFVHLCPPPPPPTFPKNFVKNLSYPLWIFESMSLSNIAIFHTWNADGQSEAKTLKTTFEIRLNCLLDDMELFKIVLMLQYTKLYGRYLQYFIQC